MEGKETLNSGPTRLGTSDSIQLGGLRRRRRFNHPSGTRHIKVSEDFIVTVAGRILVRWSIVEKTGRVERVDQLGGLLKCTLERTSANSGADGCSMAVRLIPILL